MRKLFLTCAAVLAIVAIGPASASAQSASPQLAVCLGAAQGDGSFTPQEINTGQIPGAGLGLGLPACLTLNPDQGSTWANDFVAGLTEAQPPSEAPSEEEIQAIVDAISNLDPSNPLALLGLAVTVCQNAGINDYCNAVIGGALGAPIPIGGTINLDGESGSCFGGSQSGTGSWFGSGIDSSWSLEWTADYAAGGNAVGMVSGTATPFFGGGDAREVTGLIGPGCGAGAKALVLVIQ